MTLTYFKYFTCASHSSEKFPSAQHTTQAHRGGGRVLPGPLSTFIFTFPSASHTSTTPNTQFFLSRTSLHLSQSYSIGPSPGCLPKPSKFNSATPQNSFPSPTLPNDVSLCLYNVPETSRFVHTQQCNYGST